MIQAKCPTHGVLEPDKIVASIRRVCFFAVPVVGREEQSDDYFAIDSDHEDNGKVVDSDDEELTGYLCQICGDDLETYNDSPPPRPQIVVQEEKFAAIKALCSPSRGFDIVTGERMVFVGDIEKILNG